MNIIDYTIKYETGLKNFLTKYLDGLLDMDDLKHKLLLVDEDELVGLGYVWNNSLHPYRDYVGVFILNEYRGRSQGKELFKELEARYNLQGLQSSFNYDDSVAVGFAKSCGFKLARKSYNYRVKRIALRERRDKHNIEIHRLVELHKEYLDSLIAYQYIDYVQNHKEVNPLSGDLSISRWKEIILEYISLEDSYIGLNAKGEILYYLIAYFENNETIALGYTGHRGDNIEEYKDFLYMVLLSLFKNYSQIELEVDDCDREANILANLFLEKTDKSWDTYIKN